MAQKLPFPAHSSQPTLSQGALILSPCWTLICAEGQRLAPSSWDSRNNASSVAFALGIGGEALGATACGLLAQRTVLLIGQSPGSLAPTQCDWKEISRSRELSRPSYREIKRVSSFLEQIFWEEHREDPENYHRLQWRFLFCFHISGKASLLMSCFLIQVHVLSFSETELKYSFYLWLSLKSKETKRMTFPLPSSGLWPLYHPPPPRDLSQEGNNLSYH